MCAKLDEISKILDGEDGWENQRQNFVVLSHFQPKKWIKIYPLPTHASKNIWFIGWNYFAMTSK